MKKNLMVSFDARDPDKRQFDVSECKGIGHPDTMADSIADEFSRRYSQYCIDTLGTILNHWVDKVTLVGANATVGLGKSDIHKNIGCHLIGKWTDKVGNTTIPVEQMFQNVCRGILYRSTGVPDILNHLDYHLHNTAGIALDHPEGFYKPQQSGMDYLDLRSNDTSACHGNSNCSICGKLSISLERKSREFVNTIKGIGSDVKVMVTRVGNKVSVTACIPAIPESVSTWAEYHSLIKKASDELKEFCIQDLKDINPNLQLDDFNINTKDGEEVGYIAPFGTALGKGDCGAVGRGNKFGGCIEPLAPSSAEAPAGKNPVHHAGKVYTWLDNSFAQGLKEDFGCYSEVTIVSKNGEPLFQDPDCFASLSKQADKKLIMSRWEKSLSDAPKGYVDFIGGKLDPNASLIRKEM